jgi:hypothetical protein
MVHAHDGHKVANAMWFLRLMEALQKKAGSRNGVARVKEDHLVQCLHSLTLTRLSDLMNLSRVR